MNNKENKFLLVFLILLGLDFILHRKRLKTYNQMYGKVRNELNQFKDEMNDYTEESSNDIYNQVQEKFQTNNKILCEDILKIITEYKNEQ